MKTTKLNNGITVAAKTDGSAIIATNRTIATKQQRKLLEQGIKTVVYQPRLGPVFFQMMVED